MIRILFRLAELPSGMGGSREARDLKAILTRGPHISFNFFITITTVGVDSPYIRLVVFGIGPGTL